MFALKIFRRFSVISVNGMDRMAKSYQDAVHMLNMLQSNASVIETIRATRDAQRHLSLPQTITMAQRAGIQLVDIDRLSIIHVSGTKGKGSTCAFAESILRSHGFKTGFFSSPHLVEVRERIRINGHPLSREEFSRYFWHCYHLLDDSKEAHGGAMPAYFRFLTIMAFHVFLEEKVDVAIVEVGIGGQYDCTNIVRHPVVCGVTSLGIDHTSILGDTIEKIAWHKGGIFKSGVPAVTVPQPDGAMRVLEERASEIGCPLFVAPLLDVNKCGSHQVALDVNNSGSHQVALGIPGQHQILNASLAVQLSHVWMENHNKPVEAREQATFSGIINDEKLVTITANIAEGLKSCIWPGRSQKILGPDVTYYLDGAHTDQSIEICANWFNIESAAEQATVSGRVARVLLFNSTGDRKPDILLAGLLKCKFDCAIFCPNIQRLSGSRQEDTVDMKVTLESQLRRCAENRNVWLELVASHSQQHNLASVKYESSDKQLTVKQLPNGLSCGDHEPMPTLTFNSIADSLYWASRGRDTRLLNGQYDKQRTGSAPVVNGLPDCLQTATRVLVLCTGSLHLVGDILGLLDPHICDQ